MWSKFIAIRTMVPLRGLVVFQTSVGTFMKPSHAWKIMQGREITAFAFTLSSRVSIYDAVLVSTLSPTRLEYSFFLVSAVPCITPYIAV